jgi:alpha-glucuronidase
LTTKLNKPAGRYDIAVQYFDLRTGVSHYRLLVNGKEVAAWAADDVLPPAIVRPLLDGQTSTRYTARNVALAPGDRLELRGVPDLTIKDSTGRQQDAAAQAPGARKLAPELAPVDYIEIGPNGWITPQL